MITCEVEQLKYGPIVVSFPDHPDFELFLQSDWDQASFANACGLIESSDPQLLADVDLEDITQCPDEYLSVASNGRTS